MYELACSCHMCGGAAAEAPNNALELTASVGRQEDRIPHSTYVGHLQR
jgi:hypothetical protein